MSHQKVEKMHFYSWLYGKLRSVWIGIRHNLSKWCCPFQNYKSYILTEKTSREKQHGNFRKPTAALGEGGGGGVKGLHD